jgi:hypothetical protein
MSPSHSRKKGVRYRYYLSLPLLDGRPEEAGSISRVPAAEIEQVVADAVRQELGTDSELPTRDLIKGHVTRVEVYTAKISVELREVGAETKDYPNSLAKASVQATPRAPHTRIRESPGPTSDPRRRTCPSLGLTPTLQEPQQNQSASRMRVICRRLASEVIIFAGSS